MGYLAANSSTFQLLREEGQRLCLPRTTLGSVGGALKQRSRVLQLEKDWEDWTPTKSSGPWHLRRPRCSGRAPSRAAKQTRGSCDWFASVFLPRGHSSFATFRRTKTGKPAKRCEYIAHWRRAPGASTREQMPAGGVKPFFPTKRPDWAPAGGATVHAGDCGEFLIPQEDIPKSSLLFCTDNRPFGTAGSGILRHKSNVVEA